MDPSTTADCIDLSEAYLIHSGGTIVLGRDEGAFALQYTDFADGQRTDNGFIYYADKKCGDLFRSSISLDISSAKGKITITVYAMHDGIFNIIPLNGCSFSQGRDGRRLSFTKGMTFTVSLGGDLRHDSGTITVRQGISVITVGLEGKSLSAAKKKPRLGFRYFSLECKHILTDDGIDLFGKTAKFLLLPELLSERRLDAGIAERLASSLSDLDPKDMLKAAEALLIYCRAFGSEPPAALCRAAESLMTDSKNGENKSIGGICLPCRYN